MPRESWNSPPPEELVEALSVEAGVTVWIGEGRSDGPTLQDQRAVLAHVYTGDGVQKLHA